MLTQAEIDALLAGALEAEQPRGEGGVNLADLIAPPAAGPSPMPIASPAAPAIARPKEKVDNRQIRPYNFWSPDRFSKEQMRAVELVHENLAERLTSSLPPYLRTDFRPRVVHIEQGRSDDFLKDLAPGTLFHVMAMDPLPGRVVMVISQEITWVILERLLGGAGWSDHKSRALTDIGQSLMKGTVEYMLNDIKAAWSKVVTLEPRLEDSTVNHHWVMMLMGNTRIMLVTFEITIQGTTGTMGIYIPFSMLKPVANVLNPHAWIAGREEQQPDEVARDRMRTSMKTIPLTLRAVLGGAELTIAELTSLRQGDVIQLDTLAKQDLTVWVKDREYFYGRAGTAGKRLAIQITGRNGKKLEEEEE